MQTLSYQKNLPVTGQYNVAVCGGGPAGIIAALAAARNGAKVILIERYGFLGGAATAGFVNPISVFRKNGKQVIKGMPWEFVERLEAVGGAVADYESGNVPVDVELYKLTAQRMLQEAKVELCLHTYIADALCEDGKVTHIILDNKNGLSAITADMVIDCTGDGDVAAACGMPMQEMPPKEELQPCSLGLRLGGVRTETLHGLHPSAVNARYQVFSIREKFESVAHLERIPQFGGPWFCTVLLDQEGVVNVNITRTAADATHTPDIVAAECNLREDIQQFVYLLRKYIPEFKDCFLITTATQVGFRESRRILGAHVLTAEEYITAEHFEDAVARGAHCIDIHRAKDTQQDVRFLDEAGYIPFRSLYHPTFANLLVAGRCISADRVAFASIRVQATAMALGQAAGTAAALCCDADCSIADLDIQVLRQRLLEQGADI